MKRYWLLFALILLTACGNSAVRERGVIESDIIPGEEVLLAPETVRVNVPFEVVVRTIGGGCTEADGMDVEVEEGLRVLTPYDLTSIPGRNEACPAIVTRPEHTTQVTFETSGTATIRVEGRSENNTAMTGGAEYGEATIEKTVIVEDTAGSTLRKVGITEFYNESDDVVLVPDSVQAGEAFTVTVQTYGGGCTEADDIEVSIAEGVAVLTPYDLTYIPGENEGCDDILKRLSHATQLTFEQPGSASLQIRGRKVGGDNPEGVPVTLEQVIRVR